ncbi:hypothetical protein BT96DRAFT_1088738, partial [Gymnopus androsaceus JB14]
IRNVSNKTINSSTKILPAWKKTVANFKLPSKQIPRDVRTWWNSTFDMINKAVQYRTPLNSFINDSDNGLTAFALSTTEWMILESLRDVLQDATLFCSRNSATLASVIPAMNKLDSLLATAVLKKDQSKVLLSAPVKTALLAAKRTLNHYYAATNNSRIYRLAMSA